MGHPKFCSYLNDRQERQEQEQEQKHLFRQGSIWQSLCYESLDSGNQITLPEMIGLTNDV